MAINLTASDQGYINPNSGANVQWGTIYTGGDNMSCAPIGILKFTTSFLDILGVENSVSSWSDVYFSEVLLKLTKKSDTGPSKSDYKVGVGIKLLTSSNVEEDQNLTKLDFAYVNTGLSATVSSGIYTIDLTSFFRSFNSNINFKPNSSTWYIYLQNNNDKGKKRTFSAGTLSVNAMVASGLSYYQNDTWIKCVPYYFDGSNWIRCQANYHNGTDWIKT